jgi:3-hydroxyisobutyrate dehydrogenase-like beta-hydroxyacid dehydrogenase
MRIGFIGLGNMGGPMALDLIEAGHSLVVNDVRREALEPAPWVLQEEAAGVVVRETR